MTKPTDRQFVVILGPARSGTTLLRDLIASHPAIAAVPFDVNHIWRIGNEGHADDALPAGPAELPAQIRRRLVAIAKKNAGAARWPDVRFIAEKTVGNALRTDFVETVLPGARYVRIVRDPRRTIASTIAAWKAPPDIGHLARKARYFSPADLRYAGWYAANAVRGRLGHKRGLKVWGARYPGIQDDLARFDIETVCARQWLAAATSIDRFFGPLDQKRGLSVTYEDLVSGPEALAGIWSFLGIADAARANDIHRARVIRSDTPAPSLPSAIEAETRRAVEERMAEYGYR